MPIFVYIEYYKNQFTPHSLETISYARQIANNQNTELFALCFNAENSISLQKYGVNKLINIKSENLKTFNAHIYAQILSENINGLCIFPHNPEASSVASMLSIIKNQELITQVCNFPQTFEPFSLQRKVFSGKAIQHIKIKSSIPIITLAPNTFNIKENESSFSEEIINIESENSFQIINKEEKLNKKDLTNANIVVCAGRGLKSPENWKMIEDLAEILNGATACTRPISDMGWRNYNEHTGQTGKHISPKLYIGIGISGATQHIAGINSSQCIVVINNDPQADFFKYANYGIIGDAFQIVPELTKKIKNFKTK